MKRRMYAKMPWRAWSAGDALERAEVIKLLRESAERQGFRISKEDPEHYGAVPFELLNGDAVWIAEPYEPCRASDGLLMRHNCGLESKMFFQGNPHSHDGERCEDWAHCSQTSDEQKATQ